MSQRNRLLFFILIALCLTAGFGGRSFTSRHRHQLDAQQAASARCNAHLRDARHQRDAALRELAWARAQLAQTKATIKSHESVDLDTLPEIERWTRQAKQLQELFEEHPEQMIPELTLLNLHDWLALARRVQLDTEENRRRAAALVRYEAKKIFMPLLFRSLKAYLSAHDDELPADMAELQPHLSQPKLDPSTLGRYQLTRTGRSTQAFAGTIIEERNVIDDYYDIHVRIFHTEEIPMTWGSHRNHDPRLPGDNQDLANLPRGP